MDEMRRSGASIARNVLKRTLSAKRSEDLAARHFSAPKSGWPKQRAISTARLKRLRAVHLRPINLLVSEGPLNTHLEDGFTLRCFQRLSVPNVATRRCPWWDSRCTRGS